MQSVKEQAIREKVVLKQTARIRFWRRLRVYASRHWLKAHGWIETKEGWLFPDWHPKLKQKLKQFEKNKSLAAAYGITRGIRHPQEPYDLEHACNSQEAYQDRKDEDMVSRRAQSAPAYPAYLHFRPFHWCVITLANFCFACAHIQSSSWLGVILTAIGVAFLLVAIWTAIKARREWQLDWAEEQLVKRDKNAVHNSN